MLIAVGELAIAIRDNARMGRTVSFDYLCGEVASWNGMRGEDLARAYREEFEVQYGFDGILHESTNHGEHHGLASAVQEFGRAYSSNTAAGASSERRGE